MLTGVAFGLASLGALGACLAAWQLIGWLTLGALPPVADAWRHAGVTGALIVAFFDWLPLVLGAAIAFHALVAWLGVGLYWRRAWARRGALVFAACWAGVAVAAWGVVRYALEDLARGYPDRAAFARAAQVLASQLVLVNIGLAAGLLLLLIQPAVRAQFRSGR